MQEPSGDFKVIKKNLAAIVAATSLFLGCEKQEPIKYYPNKLSLTDISGCAIYFDDKDSDGHIDYVETGQIIDKNAKITHKAHFMISTERRSEVLPLLQSLYPIAMDIDAMLQRYESEVKKSRKDINDDDAYKQKISSLGRVKILFNYENIK